jgi:uncharacterized membrane protein YccC
MQRATGTLAGVGAGILAATAASGHYAISLCIIFACVFLAFYFLQAAYGLMVFWITILISLFYGLLGFFSPALLVLRIEETALGAVIGTLVAMFILPTRLRDVFTQAAQSFLRALGDFVELAAQPGGTGLVEAAREVDRRFHQARAAAKPLTSGLVGAFAPNGARRWLRVFLACDYYARTLAARASRGSSALGETKEYQRLATRTRGNIDRVLDALGGNRSRLVLSRRVDPDEASVSPGAARNREAAGAHDLMRALAGMDQAIWLLARSLGGPKESET